MTLAEIEALRGLYMSLDGWSIASASPDVAAAMRLLAALPSLLDGASRLAEVEAENERLKEAHRGQINQGSTWLWRAERLEAVARRAREWVKGSAASHIPEWHKLLADIDAALSPEKP